MFATRINVMQLKDIASLNGKSGLFRVAAPTRSGMILESLDELRSKLVVPATARVSVLEEISIYTTTGEGTVSLKTVLLSVKAKYGDALPVTQDADPAGLASFMESVLPDYDAQRVYNSDIRKLVRWYGIISRYAPEAITEEGTAS